MIAAERHPPLLMPLGALPLVLELAAAMTASCSCCARPPGKTCWPWWLEHRHGSEAMKPVQPGYHGDALSVVSLVADLWLFFFGGLVLLLAIVSKVLPKEIHHH